MSGSKTAKDGFQNEHDIVLLINEKCENFQKKIKEKTNTNPVSAHKVVGSPKTDLKIYHDTGCHNVSAKKFDKGASFNHLARTNPEKFCKQNNLNKTTYEVLSIFTGHISPSQRKHMLKDGVNPNVKRVLMSDIKDKYATATLKDLQVNKNKIALWAFSGANDEIDLFVFSQLDKQSGDKKHRCFSKEEVLKYYNTEIPIHITKRGSIGFGNNITIQRKGGTGSPTNIQLKFKPHLIFEKARQ